MTNMTGRKRNNPFQGDFSKDPERRKHLKNSKAAEQLATKIQLVFLRIPSDEKMKNIYAGALMKLRNAFKQESSES